MSWGRHARWVLLAMLLPGCAEPVETATLGLSAPAAAVEVPHERGPARRPLEQRERSGAVLTLSRLGGEPVAIIADEDSRALLLVDPTTHAALGHQKLDGRPAQALIADDGRLYVALRDRNEVVALEAGDGPEPFFEVARIPTAAEPIGLAAIEGGLLVTSGWGRTLARYRLRDGSLRDAVPLPREPRAVLVSDDGKWAYVAHAVGSELSRVALGDKLEASAVTIGGRDYTTDGEALFASEFGMIGLLGAIGTSDMSSVLSAADVSNEPAVAEVRSAPQPQAGLLPRTVPAEVARGEVAGFGIGGSGIGESIGVIGSINGAGSIEHLRHGAQGFALVSLDGAVLAPLVLVHHGRATTSGGYGSSESFPAHQAAIASIAAGSSDAALHVAHQVWPAAGSRHAHDGGNPRGECLLPRAAAADRDRHLALVSCLGRDEVIAYRKGASEPASLAKQELRRWKVPAGPVGLAVDQDNHAALVWSQFDRKLATLELPLAHDERDAKPREPARVTALAAIAGAALSEEAQRGRKLFHASGDRRIAADGRACASCHPDGREDGLTWPSPNGPRQTPMLAGRLDGDTGPFGWNGDEKTVAGHLKHTFARLGGRGLRKQELEDLIAYVHALPTPPVASASEPELIARGQELFHSELVGCASCHRDGRGSDGARHEVGGGVALDTPSLRFIAGTGPYYHDGRYQTLGELLRETQGKMGWGADLDQPDLSALEAYLATL